MPRRTVTAFLLTLFIATVAALVAWLQLTRMSPASHTAESDAVPSPSQTKNGAQKSQPALPVEEKPETGLIEPTEQEPGPPTRHADEIQSAPAEPVTVPKQAPRAEILGVDFEQGVRPMMAGGDVIEGGARNSQFAAEVSTINEALEIGAVLIPISDDTEIEFDFFTSKPLKQLQFGGRSTRDGKHLHFVVWDYEVGKWSRISIRLAELFAWGKIREPVGDELSSLIIWAKGAEETVVKIDNIRVVGTVPAAAAEEIDADVY